MSEDHEEHSSFEAPPLDELDRLLLGYHFESFIAQGGMGAVYLARQTSLDREVAVKVLPREFSEDEEFIRSFQSEAKLMAKLNHPNLISIYDFGNIDGMLYIIMEFVKGKSLHHSANGKAINQETAVDIVSAVCSGLDHAHEAGILHRDIKPANILLGKGAIPKIGDFGLARLNDTAESGVIYGTPGYSAPEVINAPDKVDNRTDIFAVGVMFYELLTGRLPEDKYVSVSEYVEADPRFDKIIKKAIHPNIDMRYKSAQDFSDEITDVIKNPSAVSKLLVAGAKKKAPGSVKVMTAASGGNGSSTAKSKAATSSPAPTPSTAPVTHTPAPSSKLGRNIVIIILLLGAIYFVLEMKKEKEKEIADIEKTEAEKLAEKQAEKDAIRAAEAEERRKAALLNAQNNKPKNPDNNTKIPEIVKLEPLEQLARVKELLKNGERPMSMMPDTIFMRNQDSRIIMYVDKKMTWDEADTWTREHGGYIAVCQSKSDITVLMNQMPEDADSVWLGAGCSGDKGWSWVDDTPWTDTLDLKANYDRAFVKLSKFGSAGKTSGDKRLSFFIEWRADGSNPADLEYRLLRTSDTLTDINPKYPPGTITAGARNYCIIKSPVTFDEASDLALSSGGHLIAITNDEEKFEVEGIIAQNCRPGATIWTAGEKKNDVWGWQTGEKWLNLNWAASHPQSADHVVIFTAQNLLIKDASRHMTADGFMIEWSKDQSKVKVADLDDGPSNLDGGLKALKKKAKSLVAKQRAATEKKHAFNVKKLWSDLETYLRTLARNQSAIEAQTLNPIIELVKGKERVPESLAGQGPSERSREYINYAVEKQARIDFDHNNEMVQLRNSYIKQLQKLREAMDESGQVNVVRAIIKEAKAIGDTAEDFENHHR